MTNGELIEKLQKFPKNEKVILLDWRKHYKHSLKKENKEGIYDKYGVSKSLNSVVISFDNEIEPGTKF